MNYGKNNLSKRKSSISSKKKMKKKRVGVRFFKAVITCMLLLVVIGLVGGIIFAKKIIDNTPDVSAEDIQPKGFTTTIVDQNGTVIDTLKDSDSNRVYRTYDEITAKTDFLPHAFVAIEDERFYEHNGIDIQGILRAGVVGVMNGFDFTEGASTLTQQLIKNNVFDFVNEKTFFDRVERKLQEQYLALAFEKEMNKNEILEAYLNTINLGQGCLGVQTASTRYFNKDVADLTLSECAVIAAITQNPTEYDPVTNPESNAKRREKVLGNMLEQKYIDQAQYDEALADPVYDRILQTAAITEDTTPYSYFTDALIEDVIQDLMDEKGYSETQAYNLLYSEGLTIKSTQDLAIQQICDEEASNDAYYPIVEYGITDYALTIHRADGSAENYSKENLKQYLISVRGSAAPFVFSSEDEAKASIEQYKGTLGINTDAGDIVDERLNITLQPQVSVVLMDQYTGHVKAIVGGRGAKTTSLSLNRATASPKQPGSCFKVLSTYAPGLNECGMTLATTIKDEPYRYASGQPVNNWDNKYIGSARVRYAIEHSMNVCAVRTLTETVGLEKGYKYLENFGFTTLVNNDPNYPGMSDIAQATALGGITRGVLGNMLEQKYIDQAQYDEALADPVYDRILQTAAITEDTTPYSYFTDALIEDVIQDLMDEKGYSETQAYNLLYSEGLTIKSTQDLAIQQICDEEASNDAYYPIVEYGITDYALTIHRADGSAENYSKENLKQYLISVRGSAAPFVFSSEDEAKASIEQYKGTLGINTDAGDIVDERLNITLQPQVSVVLMDQYTGHVKAIVGGRGAKTTSLSLNRATASPKQPGSCFKVLSTYAPGLNECGMTLATTIKDEPYRYASGQPVNNWDNKYIGSARVRYAIEHSMNVCAVRTLTETVGLEKGYKYLENFGFTTLVNNDPNYPGMSDIAQATALGGITRGVYNIEMTAAYAAIANSGIYTEPLLYTEILDHDGNVLIDNSKPITRRVLKESTAFLLTSAMQDVINRGTGTPARLNNMPAAGKTGTTENSTDLWLSAYTPYYTCSVWTGYDEDKTLEQFWNQSWHEVIWKHIMDRIHAELEYKNFTPPASVVQRTICTQTGKLAVNGCPSITEYFDKDTLTKETCPGHGKTDDESKDDENNEDNSTNNNSGSSENLGNTNGDDGDDVDPIPPTPDPEPNPEPEGPEVIPQSRN